MRPKWAPLATPASTTARPVMMGRLGFDEFTGIYSAEGKWAMTRARLTRGSIELPLGKFRSYGSPGGGCDEVVRFPYSGNYQRSFWVAGGAGHSLFELEEKDLPIDLERNSDGGWNMHGRRENIGEPFVWTGIVSNAGREMWRCGRPED